ncbi:MAG: hypothetical protein GQ529_03270 [Methyloprofundus sp.]|nr:hypothetical protein [Methyloprofundus sp.]
MILFLKSISGQTRCRDIVAFIEPAMKVSLFGKKGTIERIKILHLKDARTNISEFHGLVTIEPEAVAKRVLKRLNRKKFLDKHIVVRQYHQRDWHNDSRLNHDSVMSTKHEKRMTDRRRKNIVVVEDIKQTFSSSKVFHRNY